MPPRWKLPDIARSEITPLTSQLLGSIAMYYEAIRRIARLGAF